MISLLSVIYGDHCGSSPSNHLFVYSQSDGPCWIPFYIYIIQTEKKQKIIITSLSWSWIYFRPPAKIVLLLSWFPSWFFFLSIWLELCIFLLRSLDDVVQSRNVKQTNKQKKRGKQIRWQLLKCCFSKEKPSKKDCCCVISLMEMPVRDTWRAEVNQRRNQTGLFFFFFSDLSLDLCWSSSHPQEDRLFYSTSDTGWGGIDFQRLWASIICFCLPPLLSHVVADLALDCSVLVAHTIRSSLSTSHTHTTLPIWVCLFFLYPLLFFVMKGKRIKNNNLLYERLAVRMFACDDDEVCGLRTCVCVFLDWQPDCSLKSNNISVVSCVKTRCILLFIDPISLFVSYFDWLIDLFYSFSFKRKTNKKQSKIIMKIESFNVFP